MTLAFASPDSDAEGLPENVRQLTSLYKALNARTWVVVSVLLYYTEIVAKQFSSFFAYNLNGRQHWTIDSPEMKNVERFRLLPPSFIDCLSNFK